jgi:hypothetical protein
MQDMTMEREAINVKVSARTKKAFRLRCIAADHTMQSAIDWLIAQVMNRSIKLPEGGKK